MKTLRPYYLFLPPDRVVGPHSFDRLREWFAIKAIPYDAQVCEEGSETWSYFAHLPRHDCLPLKLQARIERRKGQIDYQSRSRPASEDQLAKLRFFEIPLPEEKLSMSRAWELIDAFVTMDLAREDAYQALPADEDQIKELKALKAFKPGVTRKEAEDLIDEIYTRRELEDEEKARIKEEREWNLWTLEEMLNDEEVYELCHLRRLSGSTLKRLLVHLEAHMPKWKEVCKFDLGRYVLIHLKQQAAAKKQTAKL